MFEANDKVEALARALGFKLVYRDYLWTALPDGNSFKDELDGVESKLRAIVGLLGELRGLRFKGRPSGLYTILCESGNYDRVEMKLKALEELLDKKFPDKEV